MYIKDNVKMAIKNLKMNKMRSILTMLGVIIGIFSVTLITALGAGGREKMMSQLESIGTTTVFLKADSIQPNDLITEKDIQILKEKIPSIKHISPRGTIYGEAEKTNSGSVSSTSSKAMLAAGNEDLLTIGNSELIAGRNFSKEEYQSKKNVMIIDELAANDFFGNSDESVLGEKITITVSGKKINYSIIGVAKSITQGFQGDEMPKVFYLPYSTLPSTLKDTNNRYSQVILSAESAEKTEETGNAAINLLKTRHNIKNNDIYSFEMLISQVEQINSMIDIFTNIMLFVAAISLLVGGIGVMNIMLVSVTERTREIGIRKSLGAKTKAIMLQFLTESAIITIIGGIIGLVLGILSSLLIGLVLNFTPIITVTSLLVSITFSLFVGLFFGIYPAKKAAKLAPIEALSGNQ